METLSTYQCNYCQKSILKANKDTHEGYCQRANKGNQQTVSSQQNLINQVFMNDTSNKNPFFQGMFQPQFNSQNQNQQIQFNNNMQQQQQQLHYRNSQVEQPQIQFRNNQQQIQVQNNQQQQQGPSVKCKFCKKSVPKDTLETHLTYECENPPVQCDYCGKNFSLEEIFNHSEGCSKNPNRQQSNRSQQSTNQIPQNMPFRSNSLQNLNNSNEGQQHNQQNNNGFYNNPHNNLVNQANQLYQNLNNQRNNSRHQQSTEKIPCEYCNKQIKFNKYEHHIRHECKANPEYNVDRNTRIQRSDSNGYQNNNQNFGPRINQNANNMNSFANNRMSLGRLQSDIENLGDAHNAPRPLNLNRAMQNLNHAVQVSFSNQNNNSSNNNSGNSKPTGLQSKELNDLYEVKFDASKAHTLSEELKSCTICMEDFEDKEKLIFLPCTHRFHSNCIKDWLKKQRLCPICKKDVSQNN